MKSIVKQYCDEYHRLFPEEETPKNVNKLVAKLFEKYTLLSSLNRELLRWTHNFSAVSGSHETFQFFINIAQKLQEYTLKLHQNRSLLTDNEELQIQIAMTWKNFQVLHQILHKGQEYVQERKVIPITLVAQYN